MFSFTIRDVLWLTVVMALGVGCNSATPIGQSAEGRRALDRLSAADQFNVEAHTENTNYQCELSLDARRELTAWLQTGVRDKEPVKREVTCSIKLKPQVGREWLVLRINRDEVSVETAEETWRGLNRGEFEKIVRECAAVSDAVEQSP